MSGGGERQRRLRERQRAGGLVEVTVWVPAGTEGDVHALAARLRGGRTPAAARRPVADAGQGDLLADLPPVPGVTGDAPATRPAPLTPGQPAGALGGSPAAGVRWGRG